MINAAIEDITFLIQININFSFIPPFNLEQALGSTDQRVLRYEGSITSAEFSDSERATKMR